MQILIGPDGRTWNPYGEAFSRYLGYHGGDLDRVAYATRNLGFVLVFFKNRYAKIRLRVEMFSQRCLRTLEEVLLYEEPVRVVIERARLDLMPIEIVGNTNDAIARLNLLQRASQIETRITSGVTIVALDQRRINHPKRALFRSNLALWQRNKGYITLDQARSLPQHPRLGGGFTAWRQPSGRFTVEGWPKELSRVTNRDESPYIGRELRDLPSEGYTQPLSDIYYMVAHTLKPQLELVEATLDGPDGAMYWGRYERLVLPFRAAGGDVFVVAKTLSRVVRRVDL